jgi:hypothetical protein
VVGKESWEFGPSQEGSCDAAVVLSCAVAVLFAFLCISVCNLDFRRKGRPNAAIVTTQGQ